MLFSRQVDRMIRQVDINNWKVNILIWQVIIINWQVVTEIYHTHPFSQLVSSICKTENWMHRNFMSVGLLLIVECPSGLSASIPSVRLPSVLIGRLAERAISRIIQKCHNSGQVLFCYSSCTEYYYIDTVLFCWFMGAKLPSTFVDNWWK